MTLLLASALALLVAAEAPPLLVMPGVKDAVVMEPIVNPDDALPEGEPPALPGPSRGTTYRRADLDGTGASVTVTGEAQRGSAGCGEDDAILVAVEGLPRSDADYVLVPGAWPAAPSPIAREPASDARHGALLAPLFAANALTGAKITGGEAVSADLDGDGTPELILSATNVVPEAQESRAGDYAALLVQRTAGGKPETVTVSFESVGPDSGGSVENVPSLATLIAIADLDGDARMELVAEYIGYEHSFVEAWALPAGAAPVATHAYSCAP